MRVLHIDTGREMRGGQWQVLRLLEGLAAAGWTPVLAAPSKSELVRRAAGAGIRCEEPRMTSLADLARESDLVHVHSGRSHAIAAVLGLKPLVVARRVAFPVKRSFLSRWKYRRADKYIAISKCVQDTLLDAGVPPEKISVVYDGVPLNEQQAEGGLIVAPGSWDPMKGRAVVARAAELSGIPIHFSDSLDDDLRRACVFVYITKQEGLGSAVLLAMASGVPVVASRVGGLCEVIEDGETGLFAGNSPEEIAAAVRRLLDDADLRRRLGVRARERVKERFSVERMVRETVCVYEEVLK